MADNGEQPNRERREQLRAEALARLGASNEQAARETLRYCRVDELGRLAELAASYWRSIALAADRDDILTVTMHCRQVAAVTKEAFALARKLGADGSDGSERSGEAES